MAEPRFNIGVDKRAPDYNPYGKSYTERQRKILNGEISLEDVRLSELSVLVKKAEKTEDWATLETAERLYEQRKNPQADSPQYTLEEAKDILQQLTPWEIQWT